MTYAATVSKMPSSNPSNAAIPSSSATATASISGNDAFSINQLGTTAGSSHSALGTNAVVGVAIGCAAGAIVIVMLGMFTVRSLKRKALHEYRHLQPSSKLGDDTKKSAHSPWSPFKMKTAATSTASSSAAVSRLSSKQKANALVSKSRTQATSATVTSRKPASMKKPVHSQQALLQAKQLSSEQTARLLDGDVSDTTADTCVLDVEPMAHNRRLHALPEIATGTTVSKQRKKSAVPTTMSPPARKGRKQHKHAAKRTGRGASALREVECKQSKQRQSTDIPRRSSSLNDQSRSRSRNIPMVQATLSQECLFDANCTAQLLNELKTRLKSHPASEKASQHLIKRISQSLV